MGTTTDPTGARWRKSSYSASTGGDCVEIAELAGVIAIRDSKDPQGPALAFAPEEFAAFVVAARNGAFGI